MHVESDLIFNCKCQNVLQMVNGTEDRERIPTPHSKTSKPGHKNNPSSNNNNNTNISRSNGSVSSESGKKQEQLNNNNNVGSCDICERGDFASEAELAAHRKLVHHIKSASSSGKVSWALNNLFTVYVIFIFPIIKLCFLRALYFHTRATFLPFGDVWLSGEDVFRTSAEQVSSW